MLKCENRQYCAGKRPPSLLFLSLLCASPPACGESHNHSLFFPFSPREGWSDGAYAAASASHATQLQPLTSHLLCSFFFPSSLFLSCPCLLPALPAKSMPYSAAVPKLGSGYIKRVRDGAPLGPIKNRVAVRAM